MPRSLTVLFRRDPSRDRQCEQIRFEGYQVCWPDGRPVTVGLDAFCTHGQRLLGLGRHLRGCTERLIELLCFPLEDREVDLTKIPGARVRRFLLQRTGREGRIHFLDGTPTAVVFDLGRDEYSVLHWIGLPALRDGEGKWFDLAARAADLPVVAPHLQGSLGGVLSGV
ncbi:MAG TPA: hypothetical protein VFW33_04215 [Gemmataceae bacterium]|nr:hypothetical protein [Gemmataceae bacterium]